MKEESTLIFLNQCRNIGISIKLEIQFLSVAKVKEGRAVLVVHVIMAQSYK